MKVAASPRIYGAMPESGMQVTGRHQTSEFGILTVLQGRSFGYAPLTTARSAINTSRRFHILCAAPTLLTPNS